MRTCLVGLLVLAGIISDALLLPVILIGGIGLHIATFGQADVDWLQRGVGLLNRGLVLATVIGLSISMRFGWEWRQLKGLHWPTERGVRVGILLTGLLFAYAAAWLPLALSTPGPLRTLYALRGNTALAVAVGVGLGWLLVVMFRWWKHDGEGDLWEDKGLTMYIPDQGPVYYAIPSLHDRAAAALLPDLRATGLSWAWESNDHPLTLLTPAQDQDFLGDWTWFNGDGYGKDITVFGMETRAADLFLDAVHRVALLTDFIATAAGPLGIILEQESDGHQTLIFVPQVPTEPVRRLLERWDVREETIRYRRRVRGIPSWIPGFGGRMPDKSGGG